MEKNISFISQKNTRLVIIMLSVALLLCIPLIAMQFTDEVVWTISDFAVAGVLLSVTGLLCELVLRKVRMPGYRVVICVVLLITLMLIWAELAVGVFGTRFAGS